MKHESNSGPVKFLSSGSSMKLGKRMALWIIGFSSVLMCISTVLQLTYEYQELRRGLELGLDSVNIHVDTIANSLWNFDEPQIQLAVDELRQLPNIERVSVVASKVDKEWHAGLAPSANVVTHRSNEAWAKAHAKT
jgi:Periplasmic sensor domain found in signal transduction proteins